VTFARASFDIDFRMIMRKKDLTVGFQPEKTVSLKIEPFLLTPPFPPYSLLPAPCL
jgi:hypothetical protein